jgi:hypothetical protein
MRTALMIWASGNLALSACAQTTPTVTSSVVTVSNRKYTVYDYADPATKRFCVVIPEGLGCAIPKADMIAPKPTRPEPYKHVHEL